MQVFEGPNGLVCFNDTSKHLLAETHDVVEGATARMIEKIRGYPVLKRQLDTEISSAIDAFFDLPTDVCLSPEFFTRTNGQGLNSHLARKLLGECALARSIVSELRKVGLFAFVERQRVSASFYRGYLDTLIAALGLCSCGANDIKDLTPEMVISFLSWFRDGTGMKWRRDLWGRSSAVAFQCLRELGLAFARYMDSPSIYGNAVQYRQHVGGASTWNLITAKPSRLERGLLNKYRDYSKVSKARVTKNKQMLMSMFDWLRQEVGDKELEALMRDAKPRKSFGTFLLERHGSITRHSISQVGLAVRFSDFVLGEFAASEEGIRFRPLVDQSDLIWAKNQAEETGSHKKSGETKSRPLPPRLFRLGEAILAEGEAGWPGRSGVFDVTVFFAGKELTLYCPVLPTLFLSVMKLPLRVGQMKRLDSGEGDLKRFDGDQLEWVPNLNPNAGYWSRRKGKKKVPTQGYAHCFKGTSPLITGFFVNTNKTGDPYFVPWNNVELHKIFWRLAVWQETYNPVSSPASPTEYVDKSEDYPEATIAGMPHIFPLFRMPSGDRNSRIGLPPTTSQIDHAWQHFMLEIERRWNEQNPGEQIVIVSRQSKTGQPQKAIYNPHGLRVRGLTNFFENGVPIEVISKLIAGHHSIVMTIFYLKFEPSKIHAMLEKSVLEQDSKAARKFIKDFKSWSIEDARRRSAFVHEDGLVAAASMNAANKIQFCNVDIGFCPWDGTRCHDGGRMLRSNKSKSGVDNSLYGEVEGGQRNCIMCRHFISGPPWRKQLWIFGSSLLDKRSAMSERERELQEELEGLWRARSEKTGDSGLTEQLLDSRQVELNALKVEEEILDKAIFETKRLLDSCERIIALEDSSPDGASATSLIAQDRASVVEFMEVTPFEQSAMLTAAGRIYPMVHDARTEALRDKYLDAVLFNGGMIPITFRPLTDRDKRRSQDDLARFLMERLKREEMNALTNGHLRLQDLDIVSEIEDFIQVRLESPIASNLLPSSPRLIPTPIA